MRNSYEEISIYMDKFEFVEAKKYLALKGPLKVKIVHDDMYPLFKFDQKVQLRKPPKGLKPYMLACYWNQEKLNPCLIESVYSDGTFKVKFLKKEAPPRVFSEMNFLAEIPSSQVPLWWRLKFWLMRLRSALF